MWGELAAITTAVCWSLTAVFFSFSGRIIGSDVVNRSRLIFALIFLAILHFFVEGSFYPQDVGLYRWWWLGISGVLGLVLGDTFLFRAYVMVGPRLSMLMMSSVPIFSVLFGWLLFGETITGLELVGILMAIGGIGWVVTEKQQGLTVVENKAYKAGLFFGLLGALGQVSNLVTAKYGLAGGYSTVSATMIRVFVAVVILWSVAVLRRKAVYTIKQWKNKRAFPAMIMGSLTGPFLGIWFSMVAVSLARLGIASTLMALPPVILIPVEYLILKKPVSNRGIVGTLIAFLGVVLLFAQGG